MIEIRNFPAIQDGRFEWAVDHFGPPDRPGVLTLRWRYLGGRYYFRNEKDATMFLLRWGGSAGVVKSYDRCR